MPLLSRLRRLIAAALPALIAIVFTACSEPYPNSVFTRFTENNRDVGGLCERRHWMRLRSAGGTSASVACSLNCSARM